MRRKGCRDWLPRTDCTDYKRRWDRTDCKDCTLPPLQERHNPPPPHYTGHTHRTVPQPRRDCMHRTGYRDWPRRKDYRDDTGRRGRKDCSRHMACTGYKHRRGHMAHRLHMRRKLQEL
jgi:hypothetical protein